jgi:hypothetical protein
MGDPCKENIVWEHGFYAACSKEYIVADVCVQNKEISGSMKDQNFVEHPSDLYS